MRHKCLVCALEWYDGEPDCPGMPDMESGAICSDECRVILELYAEADTEQSIVDFMKQREEKT